MRIILTLILIFYSIVTYSQEKYRVVYDYTTDKIEYLLVDKNNSIVDTLKSPKLKKNSIIELHLKNVNPFALQVNTEVNEQLIHESSNNSGFNFGGLLGQIGSLGGDKLKLNVPASSLGELSRGVGVESTRGSEVAHQFENYNYITTNVSTIRSTLISNLSNPNLDKEAILKNLSEATELNPDARLPDPNKNFYGYLTTLEKLVNQEKQSLSGEIKSLSAEIETQAENRELSRGERANNEEILRNLDNTLSSLETSSKKTVEEINEVKSLYAALQSASFDQIYDYQLSADKMNIALIFSPVNKNDPNNTNKPLKRRNVNFTSRGGFKINTSLAMTLNNFGKKSHDFYISEEGVVGSEANNYFMPNLSTMINFYPMISESFNIGGSFGLSIPLSDNIGGVNFLLGPSIFMGNKNRLAISGGIAYGPVDRLTNGLKVGDTTELRSLENYTKKVYDLGYFVGISFSLFDIK